MSAAELDTATLEPLMDVAQQEHISVLLGAGASVPAGLPNWSDLAVKLLVASSAMDEATAEAFMASQDPTLAAEAARAAVGEEWIPLVCEALYGHEESDAQPVALHQAVAALAAGRAPTEVSLFTTNFDVLLEDALRVVLEGAGVDGPVATKAGATPRIHSQYTVQHLHGVLEPGGAHEGVVLTLNDFTHLGARPHPWQVRELQDALGRGPMLLAATSYRDPDIRQWLHELTSDADHAVGGQRVVFLARQGLGLNRQQFEHVRGALVEQWASIGVEVVLIHDHVDAAQALMELPHLASEGYRPPRDRAAALMATHTDPGAFVGLQERYAQQLADDLAGLRPVLGEEANLTLWLADGTGEIARFVSNDRTYRTPRDLRRVAAGHDSPWLAGQCLGRDDTVAGEPDHESTMTRRWGHVVASPISVALPGEPEFAAAAISSAVPDRPDDVDTWRGELERVASEWSDRLVATLG